MSERNTGLFLPGHVPADAVVRALLSIPGVSAADFQGDEAPRVGHGEWQGRAYTHVGLRLFEVGGFAVLDAPTLPAPDEFEMALGGALSRQHGRALFLMYEDEKASGGHALFEGGALTSRQAVDGTGARPVTRDMNGERPLEGVDASDWVWVPMAEAVGAGSVAIFGPGVRNDDDIEKAIAAAGAKPARVPHVSASSAPATSAPGPAARTAAPTPRVEPRAESKAEEPRGGGLLGRLARKLTDKARGR